MTQISKFIIALLLLGFISCKSDGQSSSKGATKAREDSNIEMDEDDETSTDLAEITPLTESQFKEAFPKSINGWPLDDEIKVVKQQATADYGDGNFTLTIYDCSGKNTTMANLFETTYAIKAQDNDHTKHINKIRDGIKTITTYRTDKNESTLVFLHRKRWFVVLKRKNSNPDKLWSEFDRDNLKNFK